MRKSLFEKIKEGKICFLEEVLKIQDLIRSLAYKDVKDIVKEIKDLQANNGGE